MKTKKLLALLLVIAMAAMLCISAFADPDTGDDQGADPGETQTPETSAVPSDPDATVGKYLKVAEGIAVPNVTFTFTFDSVPSTTNQGSTDYDRTKTLKATDMTAVGGDNSNDVADKFAIKSLFTDAQGKVVFTEPGVYQFEVTESNSAGTGATTTSEDGKTTTVTKYVNDTSKFTVRIYVKYNDSGELVISDITIANEEGDKLDPTEDPTVVTGDDPFNPDNPEGANFVNAYEVKKTIDPSVLDEDNALLYVKKLVVDDQGFEAKDQKYPFTITLTEPDNDTLTGDTVTAYIDDGDDESPLVAKTIKVNDTTEFELAKNEVLLFGDLPYGAKYTVTETLSDGTVVNHANYSATAAWSDGTVQAPNKGADITVGEGIVDDQAQDYVKVTNTLNADDVTPTGILMNNLPYIILLVVVLGGLAGYIVSKRRREQE